MNIDPETQHQVHARMMMNPACGGLAKAAAARVLQGMENSTSEFQSVYVTANEQMKWIGSTTMRHLLTESTCSFSELRQSYTTVYIIMPTRFMRYHSRFLRLLVSSAFSAFKKGGRSPVPGLFIIDEAHSLGHMREIEEGYGLDAGYNLTLWTFFQDKGQIERLYASTAASFISSSRATQVFSVRDDATLDFISKQLGRRSLKNALNVFGKADHTPLRENEEIAQEIGKSSGQAYILRGEKRPMLVRRINYFESSQWWLRAGRDPDYPGAKGPLLARIVGSRILQGIGIMLWIPILLTIFGFIIASIIGLIFQYWQYVLIYFTVIGLIAGTWHLIIYARDSSKR